MNFDLLPDQVCKQILQRLPLKDQVRIARVNRRFKNLSNMVVSLTTKLSFSEELGGIKMASVTKFLKACAKSLREAEFRDFFDHRSGSQNVTVRWFEEFSKFQFPRLVKVEISFVKIEGQTLHKMLINCPKLRRLHLRRCGIQGELPIVVCNEMESVALKGSYPVGIFEAVVQSSPNLKEIEVYVEVDDNGNDANRWRQALNRAFLERRGLEAVDVEVRYRVQEGFQELGVVNNLFLLHSLRSLKLSQRRSTFSNDTMTDISTHLGQLEQLELKGGFESWQGIAALRHLKKLRQLDLNSASDFLSTQLSPLDPGIRLLASSQSLEQVTIWFSWLAQETVYAFARECPRLQLFSIRENGVHGIESLAQVESFVAGLDCFVQQNLTIRLVDIVYQGLWSSESVQRKLAEVNEAAEGRRISLVFDSFERDVGVMVMVNEEPQGWIRWLVRKVTNFFRRLYHMISG